MSRLSGRFVPIVAGLLILLAGIGFYVAVHKATHPEAVMEASSDIAAYTSVQSSQLKAVDVPEASVTSEDLTQAEYQSKYAKGKKALITTMEVLQGDVVDKRVIASGAQSSFDIVSPDERVIAVTSTPAGAAIGTISAGDVVDVSTNSAGGSSGGAGTTFAKVICISTSIIGCQGVLPPGVSLSVTSSGSSGPGSTSPVYVLLSVAAQDATALAGQQVNLALNPFCVVGSTATGVRPDQFVSARPNDSAQRCQAPANRDATTGGTSGVVTGTSESGTTSTSGTSGTATTTGTP
jgi:Flp pilus assembly protein CpaB